MRVFGRQGVKITCRLLVNLITYFLSFLFDAFSISPPGLPLFSPFCRTWGTDGMRGPFNLLCTRRNTWHIAAASNRTSVNERRRSGWSSTRNFSAFYDAFHGQPANLRIASGKTVSSIIYISHRITKSISSLSVGYFNLRWSVSPLHMSKVWLCGRSSSISIHVVWDRKKNEASPRLFLIILEDLWHSAQEFLERNGVS